MGEEPTLRSTSGEATHPQRIGPYRIARVIAHGGMGSVFLAHQQAGAAHGGTEDHPLAILPY